MLSGGQVDPAAARREFIDPSNLDPRMGDRRRLPKNLIRLAEMQKRLLRTGCDGEGVDAGVCLAQRRRFKLSCARS